LLQRLNYTIARPAYFYTIAWPVYLERPDVHPYALCKPDCVLHKCKLLPPAGTSRAAQVHGVYSNLFNRQLASGLTSVRAGAEGGLSLRPPPELRGQPRGVVVSGGGPVLRGPRVPHSPRPWGPAEPGGPSRASSAS